VVWFSSSLFWPLAALSWEEAITERDLTDREDRLMFYSLTAAAILIGLLFVLAIS
jgi:hypothetical protein